MRARLGRQAEEATRTSLVGAGTYRRHCIRLRSLIDSFGIFFQPLGVRQLFGIPGRLLVNQEFAGFDVMGKSILRGQVGRTRQHPSGRNRQRSGFPGQFRDSQSRGTDRPAGTCRSPGHTGPLGPVGPTDAQGIQGAPGPSGPSGLSRIYTAANAQFSDPFNNNGGTVASVTVPPGNYLILGRAIVFNSDSDPQQARCFVSAGGNQGEVRIPSQVTEVISVQDFGKRFRGDYDDLCDVFRAFKERPAHRNCGGQHLLTTGSIRNIATPGGTHLGIGRQTPARRRGGGEDAPETHAGCEGACHQGKVRGQRVGQTPKTIELEEVEARLGMGEGAEQSNKRI